MEYSTTEQIEEYFLEGRYKKISDIFKNQINQKIKVIDEETIEMIVVSLMQLDEYESCRDILYKYFYTNYFSNKEFSNSLIKAKVSMALKYENHLDLCVFYNHVYFVKESAMNNQEKEMLEIIDPIIKTYEKKYISRIENILYITLILIVFLVDLPLFLNIGLKALILIFFIMDYLNSKKGKVKLSYFVYRAFLKVYLIMNRFKWKYLKPNVLTIKQEFNTSL